MRDQLVTRNMQGFFVIPTFLASRQVLLSDAVIIRPGGGTPYNEWPIRGGSARKGYFFYLNCYY